MPVPVIAIFDIGKTNKKVFLFDEGYAILFEKSIQLPEITDEDGFPCEDINGLTKWVIDTLDELFSMKAFQIRAINFSAHGASFVNVDEQGVPVTPLYNYLKPFPEPLLDQFYKIHGGKNPSTGKADFALATASPVLGHLNSGMQLYWLKNERPESFSKLRYALHLPEYFCFLITKRFVSGITSIGCHTNLWDFRKNDYHAWVKQEGISQKLAPIVPSDEPITTTFRGHSILSGIGLHDSSAALIPYLTYFSDPFVLLSTGTWSISLNPFNDSALTADELERDCLCYLSYLGKPVKASRLFAGHDHDEAVTKICEQFHTPRDAYKKVSFSPAIVQKLQYVDGGMETSPLTFEEAYHQLMIHLIAKQKDATNLVIRNAPVKNIFVDGGFGQNEIYMNLLAKSFPGSNVCAASLHQASALGAAIALHKHWNTKSLPVELIETTCYK